MNQPSENVALTFEQLQQINVVEKRLGNLQTEVGLAVKQLTETRTDLEQLAKDKVYQEEMLGIVKANVAEKQKKATELDEAILDKSNTLSKLSSEISTKSQVQNTKDMEFKNREDEIEAKELKLSDKEASLAKEAKSLESDKLEFNEKVAKLKEVISTF